MRQARPPVALTMGDPSGVGAEISIAAWRALRSDPAAAFFLIDDPRRYGAFGAPVVEISTPEDALQVFADAVPILPELLAETPVPGRPAAANAAAVIRSIERAVGYALDGSAGAVTTNPIHKKALYDGAGFAFPGHTEFLAHLAGAPRSVMMLAAPELRAVPVTIHIPLREVPSALTADSIVETGRILAAGLTQWFGIQAPRLAVAGLNPHAGEGGAMGHEDAAIVAPAVAALQAEGINARGPLPADTMFHPEARAGYDAALCMYHDQALIPLKTLDFFGGVNVTLGLPFLRTSPDHGVAYDIAGQGRARPDSLIAALKTAAQL